MSGRLASRHFKYCYPLSSARGFLHSHTYQPFDLTDLDWSPELLIAANDEDEQNSRLARLIWEDNGLDVPESFLQTMLKFLGGSYQIRFVYSLGCADRLSGSRTRQRVCALEYGCCFR